MFIFPKPVQDIVLKSMSENSINGITLGSLSVIQWAYLVLRLWFLIPFPRKKNEDLLEKWLLRTGARHIQVEAGVSCSARKQRSTWNQPANEKTYMRVCQRGRGVKGQRWNNLSTKINNYWIVTQSIKYCIGQKFRSSFL